MMILSKEISIIGLVIKYKRRSKNVPHGMQFLAGLEFTLRNCLPQEKLVALRQCIKRVFINKPAGIIKLRIRLVPAGNLQATGEVKCLFDS